MRAKLFRDVPFARTGWQTYTGDEAGEPERETVAVHRSEYEVARSAGSFEGSPITVDHPDKLLTPEQVDALAVGIASGVRFDGATQQLRADLLVWDQTAIRQVADGVRELSAGYTNEQDAIGPANYEQRDIVGNHIALVPHGRAGSAVRIGA